MRLGLVLSVIIFLIMGTMYMASGALSLMNHPSDGSVGAGVLVLLFLAACWSAMVIGLKNKFFEEGTISLSPSARKWFKKLFLVSSLAFCPTLSGCMCTVVKPGYVGIKINYAGSDRGVENLPQTTGWTFYNWFTETVLEFPTFVQTIIWSHSPHEGSPNNEEISFNDKKGMNITADISISYRLDPKKVPAFYVMFRTDDLVSFSHSFLRNTCRDAFGEVACKYAPEEIYGEKKPELLKEVSSRINEKLNPFGIIVEQFGIIGTPRLPQNVIDSLNASQAATQNAIRTENEIRQTRAEAQKSIAVSQGQAQATLQQAKASADARLIQAKAEAESNMLLAKSLSPELIRWRMITVLDKWDGRRPMIESATGSGFIFQLPLPEKEISAGK